LSSRYKTLKKVYLIKSNYKCELIGSYVYNYRVVRIRSWDNCGDR